MIYQPSNIIPSNFAGVGLGTVDATKDITISWQVNGNSPMTAFQITIYLINSNGTLTQVHATEILTEGIPSGGFYSKDGKGNPQQFVYSLPNTPWTTWGVANGNEYQLSITQYWGNPTNGNYPFSVEQYSHSAFITRTTPNLRVDLDDYIESDLYFVTTPISVGNYYIVNDDIVNYFYLPENLAVNDIIIIAYNDKGYYRKNGVWRNISLSTTGSGTNITDSLLYLAYFPAYTAPQTSFTGIYSQAQGDTINSVEWKISLLDEQASIQKNVPVSGQILYDTNVVNTQQLFFTPNFLQSNNIYVVSCTVVTQNGVSVSSGLVYFLYYDNFDFDAQNSFCSNSSDGALYIDVTSSDSAIEKIAFYLKDEGINKFIFNKEFNAYQPIKIFSLPNNTSPQIEIFGINESGNYSNPIVVSYPNYFNTSYYLYEATQDDEFSDVYHVVNTWRFGNNISSSAITNNNTPNWLTNFTPYRLRQPSSRLGESGTLQALLSNYNQSENFYQDTVKMMQSLKNASISTNTFFLKDIKGNFYMVGISSPITQTIDTKSKIQEVKISISWEEVGDASIVSLIQVPGDSGWENDQVLDVVFDVDLSTGMLNVTYPTNYQGTTFSLENNQLFATTPNGTLPANFRLEENGTLTATITENS